MHQAAPVEQPRWSLSLVRGMSTVGRSPRLLGTALIGALVLWLLSTVPGPVHFASPGVLAQIESLAPVHTLLDIQFLATADRVVPPIAVGALGVAILLVRAVLTVFVLGFATSVLTTEGTDRDHARMALARLPAALVAIAGLEIAFAIAVEVSTIVLEQIFGAAGALLALVLVTYFLIYAPVVAVAEPTSVADAVKLATRAPRVPGRSHVLFALVYPFASLLLASRSGTAIDATPSILVWAYALLVTFVHVSVLVALAYRWLRIRAPVVEGTLPPPRWRIAPADRGPGRS